MERLSLSHAMGCDFLITEHQPKDQTPYSRQGNRMCFTSELSLLSLNHSMVQAEPSCWMSGMSSLCFFSQMIREYLGDTAAEVELAEQTLTNLHNVGLGKP